MRQIFGWFAVHRKIFSPVAAHNPFHGDSSCLSVFVTLLGWASIDEADVEMGSKRFKIKRGEVAFSILSLEHQLGLSTMQIRRCLKKLEELATIEIVCRQKGRVGGQIARFINYEKYQFRGKPNDITDEKQDNSFSNSFDNSFTENKEQFSNLVSMKDYLSKDHVSKTDNSFTANQQQFSEQIKQPSINNKEKREETNIKPPLTPPLILPEKSKPKSSTVRGRGLAASKDRKLDWDARSEPLAGVFDDLVAIPAYLAVFDLEVERAKLAGLQERYKLTVEELQQISWDFREWACGLSARQIKSPRGTLNTFCRNYATRRNENIARCQKNGQTAGSYPKIRKDPAASINGSWQDDWKSQFVKEVSENEL